MNDLIEGEFGHGALRETILSANIRRLMRPKHAKIGMAPALFDWEKGYDCEAQTGPLSIKDQGQTYSCGGEGGSRWEEIARITQLSEPKVELSGKSLYSQGWAAGGGMSVNMLQQVICSKGVASEALVPSYENGGVPSEAFMRDGSWRQGIAAEDALKRAGWIPTTVGRDMESIAVAARDSGSVILMIEGSNNGTWRTAYPKPPAFGTPDTWFHYVAVRGASVRDGKRYIDIYQSWGKGVGERGIQHLGEEYFSGGRIYDAFTFAPAESLSQRKVRIITQLLSLYQRLMALVQKDARIS